MYNTHMYFYICTHFIKFQKFIKIKVWHITSQYRDNPTKAEMQTMDKNCLPIFKYFRSQRKTKILVHGFGDSAEDSLMFPLLRDGM